MSLSEKLFKIPLFVVLNTDDYDHSFWNVFCTNESLYNNYICILSFETHYVKMGNFSILLFYNFQIFEQFF